MEEKARQEAEAREREEEQRRREQEEEEEALRRELLRLQELQQLRNAKKKKKEKTREVPRAEPVTQNPRLLRESARTVLENLKNAQMERCIMGTHREGQRGAALQRLLNPETAPNKEPPGKPKARQPPAKKTAEVPKMVEPALKITTSAVQTQTENRPPPVRDPGPEEEGGKPNGQKQPTLVLERAAPVPGPQPEPEPVPVPVQTDLPPPACKAATSESPQPKTKTKKNKKKKGEKTNSSIGEHFAEDSIESICVVPLG